MARCGREGKRSKAAKKVNEILFCCIIIADPKAPPISLFFDTPSFPSRGRGGGLGLGGIRGGEDFSLDIFFYFMTLLFVCILLS